MNQKTQIDGKVPPGLGDAPLGRRSEQPTRYTPSLLYAVERKDLRHGLLLDEGQLPFHGADLWTGYELSWLDRDGKPECAVVRLTVPCDSRAVFESKSFKLYLNSFSQTAFSSAYDVARTLEADLSVTAGAQVLVDLLSLSQVMQQGLKNLPGDCLDPISLSCDTYRPDPGLLELDENQRVMTSEVVYSNLLRTICPVTGQPDIGSVQVRYSGPRIKHVSLLRYIVSYREHSGFHEQCVERMFLDIMDVCRPSELSVYARFNRRGGIDINPYRSTARGLPEHVRLPRQ